MSGLGEFKIGDVVMLKSGGPEMTITGTDMYENVSCTWFDGKKTAYASFPAEALEKVED